MKKEAFDLNVKQSRGFRKRKWGRKESIEKGPCCHRGCLGNSKYSNLAGVEET